MCLEKRSGKLLSEYGSVNLFLCKIIRFSDVFRGYRNWTLGTNNPFYVTGVFPYPLKTSENQRLMRFSAFFVQGHLKHRWDLRATVWNDPISPAAQWTFRSKNNRTYWHVANGSVNANTVEIKNVGSDFRIWSCHYHGIWMILVIWSLLC